MRAVAVVLAVVLAACASEPPVAGPPPRGAAPGEATPRPSVECSASTVTADLPTQPELPPAVAATRRAIFAAATACDLDALDELAPADLSYSFGDAGDPVAHWRQAEARREPVLRRMAEVLRATPAEQDGLWVWPAFFLRPVAEWTAADRQEAERLLADDLDLATASGDYLGHRLGIAADGTWRYFVAGD